MHHLEEAVKNIHWLGHDCFRLEGSKVVYFDPYQLSGAQKPGDIVLITHEHFDHCSPDDLAKVLRDGAVIVTNAKSAEQLDGKNVRVVAPGDVMDVAGVKIEALAAYNTNKDFHPKSAGMLSFVVTLDGVTYYHAGDADFMPEMKDIRVDIAFLPVSGTYVMTADEAVQAARAMKPEIAIPMHYGAIVGTRDDALNFKNALEGEVRVVVLEKE